MNEAVSHQAAPKRESWWHRIQRGQALVEYWPTLPVGVMIMISAAAIIAPMRHAYQTTADVLNGCEVIQLGPTSADLNGGHRVEVVSSNYNGSETTVVIKVSSGDQPAISHVVFGFDADTASKIVYANYDYQMMYDSADPTTGKFGIKFDQGYSGNGNNGNDSGGPKKARLVNAYRPRMVDYVEEREIVLTFTGRVDFVEYVEVTTKSGSDQVSTGTVSIPSATGDIVRCND
jgi:hypothetical protein